jgi:GNAT superfamily N-acetyltransferase
MTLPAGALVIARLRGNAIGCGAIKFSGKEPAHLRRMWVSPSVRGLGVGRRLLSTLEDVAHAHGARRVRLDTHRSLTEAIAMYRRSGYTESQAASAEKYADYWFEKKLTPRRNVRSSRASRAVVTN